MEEHTCPLPARMDNAVSLESEYGANKWGFMRKERGSVRKTITSRVEIERAAKFSGWVILNYGNQIVNTRYSCRTREERGEKVVE